MAGNKKGQQEINASSMADIAFLLLIFFLVTTTIDQDKGILHGLPPWDEETLDIKINKRNILQVLVNSNDQLLVNNEFVKVSQLREITKRHITNNGRLPNYSLNPQDAVVSLKNDRGTSYGIYIEIQNELKAAYSEIRNEKAAILSNGSMTYKEIEQCSEKTNTNVTDAQRNQCDTWKKEIRAEFPMKISEAEPTQFGPN